MFRRPVGPFTRHDGDGGVFASYSPRQTLRDGDGHDAHDVTNPRAYYEEVKPYEDD